MDDVFTVVGMKDVSFKGQDGSQVTGWNLFLTYENPHVTGLGVEKIFISTEKFARLSFIPEIGRQCRLSYNKYGKVRDLFEV